VHTLIQFVFSGNYHQPTRLHTAIKLFGVTPGFDRSVVIRQMYFASRAVAAGLSDRDAKDALRVVSLQYLGLGNTLMGPGTCSYGYHQKMHRNYNVAVVVVDVFERKKGRKKERDKQGTKNKPERNKKQKDNEASYKERNKGQ
jgi:hypothetical protein